MAVLRHWRAALGAAIGIAAGLAAFLWGQRPGLSVVIGADAGAAFFIATMGWVIFRDEEADVRRRASYDDANVPMIIGLVVGAMTVSLGALVVALHEGGGKGADKSAPLWLVALAVLTLVQSWLVVQMAFTVHYAHMYFGDADSDGHTDRGVQFQGDPPNGYRDFWYMAVCMGATFQVSDFSLTDRRFRDTVTIHALIAFAFNTMVLALGVGIVGNLLG